MLYAGTSFVTTAPAPIKHLRPSVNPGKIVAFAPIEAPNSTTVFGNSLGYCFDLGFLSLVNVAFGPINTLS